MLASVPALLAGVSLQALDPAVIVDAPGTVRAAASFLLTVVFGGAVVYRHGNRLDEAVDASMSSPLRAVLYGFVAFGLLAYVVVFAFDVLSSLGVGVVPLAIGGAAVLVFVLLSFAGLGFAVVGAWITDLAGIRDPWLGLVGVGALGAVGWVVLPVLYGALLWLAIAAVGIGGPTRLWIHDSTLRAKRG